ncbi:hypothetical protein AHAS_Ahas09G0166100 [Arachis hypogaea]
MMQVSTAVTTHAMERMGHGNGNGTGNEEETRNNLGVRPMTLVAFLKFLEFVAYPLLGEAKHWWQRECRLMQLQNEDIPWELFQTIFYKKYFLKSIKEARELELMQMKQMFMTVVEHTRKFVELYRFLRIFRVFPSPTKVGNTSNTKIAQDNIMSAVALLEIRRFSELVNKSRVVEDCAKKIVVARDNCEGTNNQSHGEYFQSRGPNFKWNGHAPQCPQGQGNFRRNNNAQFHLEKGSSLCYTCGLSRHIVKDCHRGKNQIVGRNQQPIRVFALDNVTVRAVKT